MGGAWAPLLSSQTVEVGGQSFPPKVQLRAVSLCFPEAGILPLRSSVRLQDES